MKKQLSYIDSVHRSGTIWNISVMILLLAFPLTVAALFGAAPDWGALVVGLIATAPMYWAVGVIETITFVPMLGAGGSYLSFVTGNISNLKLPCAINALEQNNVSANSEEGEVISTIAIATSSIVTTVIIIIGVILIVPLTPVLEAPVLEPAFAQMLPGPVRRTGRSLRQPELEDRRRAGGADAGSVHFRPRPERRYRGHYGACECSVHHCRFPAAL